MTSIDEEELFEQYYQNKYDYNTTSLSQDEIDEIKKLAKEKRVNYALAPIGTGIFEWILMQEPDIRIHLVDLESDNIDGMLYIPTTRKERAYIILNAKKALVNQVFAAAHEYYHYIKDYERFKKAPYICDFSMLKDVNEKRACRFAAELLLPAEALQMELKQFCAKLKISDLKELDNNSFAALAIVLTIKYQIPLKAVIYRLEEEAIIGDIKKYIDNYECIKNLLIELSCVGKRVDELYNCENLYITDYDSVYRDMELAYKAGFVSEDDIRKDTLKLKLDENRINAFLEEDSTDSDDPDDDIALFAIINKQHRG